MGSAWDKKYETTYGSVGAGIRFNIFNVLILRYDIGKKLKIIFLNFKMDYSINFSLAGIFNE